MQPTEITAEFSQCNAVWLAFQNVVLSPRPLRSLADFSPWRNEA